MYIYHNKQFFLQQYIIQPSPSTESPVTFEDESGDTNFTLLWFDIHAESLGLGAITVIASLAFLVCIGCCCFACQKNCCWPCSFFRRCRSCCPPKNATDADMPLDVDANADDDLDMVDASAPRRRSPVSSRQGQPGNSPTFNRPIVKKPRPRASPDHPRRNKFTARQHFQESPASRRSMIIERHNYATLPGAQYDTGRVDHWNLLKEANPPTVLPLGPIGTLRDEHGRLFSVVSTAANRSHLSLPEGRSNDSTSAAPHVPVPTPSRAESLLSINSPCETDVQKK